MLVLRLVLGSLGVCLLNLALVIYSEFSLGLVQVNRFSFHPGLVAFSGFSPD